MVTLMRLGWGTDDPGFRQLFTSPMIPGGTKEQTDSSTNCNAGPPHRNARLFFRNRRRIDVTDLLPRVNVPTLVMHVRDGLGVAIPFEAGRQMAARHSRRTFFSSAGSEPHASAG